MLKFLFLTVLTFVLSNMIIYSYQKAIQKTINLKTITTVAIMVSMLGAAFYNKPANVTHGAQTNHAERGIHDAVIAGNLEAVTQYINGGNDLNVKQSGGSSPLIIAAVFGKTEIALAFIEAGADVNLRNNEGSTPLLIPSLVYNVAENNKP